MVGDDDVGSLRLQMLPAAHLESKTQEILHMANHEADNPGGEKKRLITVLVKYRFTVHGHVSTVCRLHINNHNPASKGWRWNVGK